MLRFRTAFDLDDEAERLRATWAAPQRVELIHLKAELLCELKKLASGQRCLRGHSPRRSSTLDSREDRRKRPSVELAELIVVHRPVPTRPRAPGRARLSP